MTDKDKKAKPKKKDAPQTARGMRDIVGEEFLIRQGFYEKAQEIAMYYGFTPIQTPIIEKEDLLHPVGEHTDIVTKEMYTLRTKGGDKLVLRPEGTNAVMRAYLQNGMHTLPQPVMLFYGGSFFRHENPQFGRYREFGQFGVEIIGTEKSIADAMTIKLITTILQETGAEDIVVDINSLGDKECRINYRRALSNYFKKHAAKLTAQEKDLIKNNPLRLLDSKSPTIMELKDDAPESIEYLTGKSKQHFKEVMEYLDALNVPYRIESNLVRGLDYYSQTVFEIAIMHEKENAKEGDEPLRVEVAGGGRYDYLAKAIGAKKDIPGVGGAIGVDRLLSLGYGKHLSPRIVKKPKVFFIQLGFEAKLKSLEIIETLRKSKVPVKQSLSKDGLSTQLGTAERLKIPWVIILGQKEVLDNTVIVRNMADRSQKTIDVEKLPDQIKKIFSK